MPHRYPPVSNSVCVLQFLEKLMFAAPGLSDGVFYVVCDAVSICGLPLIILIDPDPSAFDFDNEHAPVRVGDYEISFAIYFGTGWSCPDPGAGIKNGIGCTKLPAEELIHSAFRGAAGIFSDFIGQVCRKDRCHGINALCREAR